MRRLQYDRPGAHAIPASAFGLFFEADLPAPVDLRDGVAIVRIAGPLTRADGTWFDSYPAIRSRVTQALTMDCRAVLLHVDSPGGDAIGCLETARDLRAIAKRAGKPLLALAAGQMTSAAYALACAASTIYATPTSQVGSIGVISAIVDQTKADEQDGLRWELFASGARKTDGNCHIAISDGARAVATEQTAKLATMFFALVSESRRLTTDAVSSLEAGVFLGDAAQAQGLVDRVVGGLEDVLAEVASGKALAPAGGGTMDEDETKESLRKMAEGDDDKQAARAKKALAALEDDEEPDAEDEEPAKDEPAPDAEDEEEPARDAKKAKAEDDEEPAKALAARVQALEDGRRRATLLAKRPDLRAEFGSAPLATLEWAAKHTQARPKAAKVAAPVTPAATRGSSTASRLMPSDAQRLSERMGLTAPATCVRRGPTDEKGRTETIFGVTTPEQARAARAEKGVGR